jgi:hypothetical protein
MYSITNINNSKPPSPSCGGDDSFNEVDNALLFMCYAYYFDFWPSNVFNELHFLSSCCSRLVEWLVLLEFFFHISHSFFKEQCYLHLSTIERCKYTFRSKKQSQIMVKIVNFLNMFFFYILKLY